MSDQVTCCGALEVVEKRDGSPLYRPMTVNSKTLNLGVGGWALAVTPLTPSGRVSSRGQGAIFINYCPFCGKKLVEDTYGQPSTVS